MVEEEAVMDESKGFLCRKCKRAFEAFQTTKDNLLQSAEAALQHMPSKPKAGGSVVGTSQSRRRLLSEEDYAHELAIPAKRPRTAQNPTHIGSSPTVQVIKINS